MGCPSPSASVISESEMETLLVATGPGLLGLAFGNREEKGPGAVCGSRLFVFQQKPLYFPPGVHRSEGT